MNGIVRAQWQAPAGVQALTTTARSRRLVAAVRCVQPRRSCRRRSGRCRGESRCIAPRTRSAERSAVAAPGAWHAWSMWTRWPRVKSRSRCCRDIQPDACAGDPDRRLPADRVRGRRRIGHRRRTCGLARSCGRRARSTVVAMRHDPARIAGSIGPGIRVSPHSKSDRKCATPSSPPTNCLAAFKTSPRPGRFLCDSAMPARLRLMQARPGRDRRLCTHADAGAFLFTRRDQRSADGDAGLARRPDVLMDQLR